ncbi:type IV pilus modification PilV family protein [Agrobacterium burrii]
MARAGRVSEDGFTLVEVLCAFAILSLGAVIVLQTIQLGSKSIGSARERVAAKRVTSAIVFQRFFDRKADSAREGIVGGFRWTVTGIEETGWNGGPMLERLRLFRNDGSQVAEVLIERGVVDR